MIIKYRYRKKYNLFKKPNNKGKNLYNIVNSNIREKILPIMNKVQIFLHPTLSPLQFEAQWELDNKISLIEYELELRNKIEEALK